MRGSLAILLTLGVCAGSLTTEAVAEPIVQGAASVNGENIPEEVKARNFIPPNRILGLSIAGAQVNNGAGQLTGAMPKTDYKISSGVVGKAGDPVQRDPNVKSSEAKRLDAFLQALQALPALKKDDKDA